MLSVCRVDVLEGEWTLDDVSEVRTPKAVGDGAASPAEPLAVGGEHSCALPLLPYTFIPETLARKGSGAMAVSASRACGIM